MVIRVANPFYLTVVFYILGIRIGYEYKMQIIK